MAGAQGINLIDGGYVYTSDLLERPAQVLPTPTEPLAKKKPGIAGRKEKG